MSQPRAQCGAILLAACLAPWSAIAQDAKEPAPSAPAAACEARPGAPQWLPCGPDRVLSEAEVRAHIVKDGMVTKIVGTSAKSGKRYFINIKPGGKLDTGLEGGVNIGKSWKFSNGKLCRDYYRITDVHCGVFELAGTALYLVDDGDPRSPINSIEFTQP